MPEVHAASSPVYTRAHNFNVVLHLLINASRAERLERGGGAATKDAI